MTVHRPASSITTRGQPGQPAANERVASVVGAKRCPRATLNLLVFGMGKPNRRASPPPSPTLSSSVPLGPCARRERERERERRGRIRCVAALTRAGYVPGSAPPRAVARKSTQRRLGGGRWPAPFPLPSHRFSSLSQSRRARGHRTRGCASDERCDPLRTVTARVDSMSTRRLEHTRARRRAADKVEGLAQAADG